MKQKIPFMLILLKYRLTEMTVLEYHVLTQFRLLNGLRKKLSKQNKYKRKHYLITKNKLK